MKKSLLILALQGLIFLTAQSQCDFGNMGIKINSIAPGSQPNTCVINFDLYFDVRHNPGGKYFWIHIWPASAYPNYSYPQSHPPTTSQVPGENTALDSSLTTFGYYHQGGGLFVFTTYPPDLNAPGFQSGFTITEVAAPTPITPERYTALGLTITLPNGCNVAQRLIADLWESQSANSQTVACVSKNQSIILNDPTIVGGLLRCSPLPRQYRFGISTLSDTAKTVNYKVVIDDGDAIYNALKDTLQINSGTTSISAGNPFQTNYLDYLPYSTQKPYADKSLWVVVLKNNTDQPNDILARIDNSCIPLPVQFSSFTATRVKENVMLRWSTASEYNNRGFYIERKDANRDWVQLGFVNTAAGLGNSNERIEYSYTDLNNTQVDLCQYRLRQVDMDGKFTYSLIRAVNGIAQLNKVMVFPNPSANGEFTVILNGNDKGADLRLYDMNGKEVRTWTQVSGDRARIFGIPDGLYMLKVIFHDRAEVVTTKLMITR